MNVMNRPLFRQAGGPMEPMPADMMPPAPAPMPADMGMGAAPPHPPPDMGMAMEQAQMEGMEEGANVAGQYMAETLMNIDGSENYESLINGLRGNEMPLQARYAELAEFVGPEDAQATPESVLALTQPGIMMTEQGAANSGIGQLMQGMVDDVAMTTDTGPTPMGQGIGELMMSGAPEAPVPQNFRYGGAVGMHKGTPVQKFQDGMGAASNPYLAALAKGAGSNQGFAERTKGTYEDLLPLFQDLVPEPYTKGQFLLDIAQSGLAYAGGRDPLTGENMAGQSGLSQLARAAAPLPAKLSQAVADTRKSQQAVKTAALQAGLQRAQTQEESEQATNLALLKALFDDREVKKQIIELPDGTRKLYDLNEPSDFEEVQKALDRGGRPLTTVSDKNTQQQFLNNNFDAFKNATLSPEQERKYFIYMNDLYGPKTEEVYDAAAKRMVKKNINIPPPAFITEAEIYRRENNPEAMVSNSYESAVAKLTKEEDTKISLARFDKYLPTIRDETGKEIRNDAFYSEVGDPDQLLSPMMQKLKEGGYDFSKAFGSPAAVQAFFNVNIPAFTFGLFSKPTPEITTLQEKFRDINALALTALVQARGQRVTQQTLDALQKTLPNIAGFFQDAEKAKNVVEATLESFKQALQQGVRSLKEDYYEPEALREKQQSMRQIAYLYQTYEDLYKEIDTDVSGKQQVKGANDALSRAMSGGNIQQ